MLAHILFNQRAERSNRRTPVQNRMFESPYLEHRKCLITSVAELDAPDVTLVLRNRSRVLELLFVDSGLMG